MSQEFPGCYAFMVLLLQHKDQRTLAISVSWQQKSAFDVNTKTIPTINPEEI